MWHVQKQGETMRRYLVSAAEMKQYDRNTTEHFGMPSLLLMERAALVTVEELCQERGSVPCRVLVAAGCGNNGGDGLAIGRLLLQRGYDVRFALFGEAGKRSRETAKQIEILTAYGADFDDKAEADEYDIIIDALFGVGLSRRLEGSYADAVHWMNAQKADRGTYLCSVDIPSGIHSDTGEVMGCAVEADLTVTYAYEKYGQILYPGCLYCGRLCCREIGIDERSFLGQPPLYTHLEHAADLHLPERRADGNKGTFGKVLVIAGNSRICGAALLAAQAVFRMGAGMVRVVTAVQNRETLQQCLPEAMLLVYEDGETGTEAWQKQLADAVGWADCILAGPGIGTDLQAEQLLTSCIRGNELPLVLDADALNLLATKEELRHMLKQQKERRVILTPHLAEFARLCRVETAEAKRGLLTYPQKLAEELSCTVVCKDARTVVVSWNERERYLNTTGNSGMATAGSGDVLAGMLAGLLVQMQDPHQAAVSGVFLHGIAGDLAAEKRTEASMTASDIIEQIQEGYRLYERKVSKSMG